MKATRQTRSSFALLLAVVLIAAASVSAADASLQPGGTPQLQDAPPNAAPSNGQGKADGGSISAPANGADAQAILAGSSHMMGTTDDSTEGDDDSKGSGGASNGKGGKQPEGVHHGQCVIGCASKSTAGVGCGNNLSKPACFCKSENFIDQTFSCINATCPQQFHGAAGVITSICGVTGEPGIVIPGYNSSSNLENMPTISDVPKTNGTNATRTGSEPPTPASGVQGGSGEGGAGVTSTFSMPVGMQTPVTSGPNKTGSGTAPVAGSSGATSIRHEAVGVVVAVGVAAMTASIGVWTLF